MKIIRREPRVGYLDSWLWLPKSHTSELQIGSALSYFSARNKESIMAWEDSQHHYKVPRNYICEATLGHLPYPVYDTRFTDFPKVDLQSRVVLDSREPTQTYQRDGSAALLAVQDGILCLRCGAGKTVVALHTASLIKQPVLIVVTDKGLARQWMEEIDQFLGIPESEIGRVGGDKGKFDWEHPITVALVQTLASRVAAGTLPIAMTRHFGVVILDEVHLMGAPYFNTAIPPFHGRRWGLSATPSRDDGFDSLLKYTMGNVVYSYLTPDLKPVVFFRRLATRPDFAKTATFKATHDKTQNLHFGKLYSYFGTDNKRTDEIAKEIRDAISEGRQVLVLSHSRTMVDALEARFPDSGVCHSDVREGERIRRIRECNPVIAIMQLGKQALNKPKLDTLFICEPFTKSGALQQTMGRVLRSFSGKKRPIVVFFEDVNIRPMTLMCNKLRKALIRWPEHKGGAIEIRVLKAKE